MSRKKEQRVSMTEEQFEEHGTWWYEFGKALGREEAALTLIKEAKDAYGNGDDSLADFLRGLGQKALSEAQADADRLRSNRVPAPDALT